LFSELGEFQGAAMTSMEDGSPVTRFRFARGFILLDADREVRMAQAERMQAWAPTRHPGRWRATPLPAPRRETDGALLPGRLFGGASSWAPLRRRFLRLGPTSA